MTQERGPWGPRPQQVETYDTEKLLERLIAYERAWKKLIEEIEVALQTLQTTATALPRRSIKLSLTAPERMLRSGLIHDARALANLMNNLSRNSARMVSGTPNFSETYRILKTKKDISSEELEIINKAFGRLKMKILAITVKFILLSGTFVRWNISYRDIGLGV